MKTLKQTHRGFTLIEMLVAVSLFTIVMTISIGSLLDMVSANRKAQAIQSVMNNLNVALDGMVRNARMGTNYHCGSGEHVSVKSSCPQGDTEFAFEAFDGDKDDTGDQWVYWVDNKRLYKSEKSKGAGSAFAITAPEIEIDLFRVYVTGAGKSLSDAGGDTNQPKVVFVIQGTAAAEGNTSSVIGTQEKVRTTFNVQAVATQRALDL